MPLFQPQPTGRIFKVCTGNGSVLKSISDTTDTCYDKSSYSELFPEIFGRFKCIAQDQSQKKDINREANNISNTM